MAASDDPWVREYNEAVKLADDTTKLVSERSSMPGAGPEAQRYSSALRRKLTILGTRLDSLQYQMADKDMNRRKDMVASLRSKVNQMASTLNTSKFANGDNLVGAEIKPFDTMSRPTGLKNVEIVGLHRQILKEQDEDLEKLGQTVISTKHIALAINEELDLHTRLIVELDEDLEVTESRLQQVQRRLAILNKRTKDGCSCLCLVLSVIGIVILVAVIYMLIRYL